MSQILQNVIAFLPYAYRTRTLFGEGTYGRTLLIDIHRLAYSCMRFTESAAYTAADGPIADLPFIAMLTKLIKRQKAY